jgi:hypothetical protein
MSMAIAAVGVGAAATIGGAAMQGSAARDAAATQASAADRATQMQWDMYQQQRADQEPWRKAGADALGGLGNADFQRDFTMNDFQQDPGYAFRMQQGQKALERSRAAKGLLGTGGTLKALNDYGQNMGAQEYQNSYNRFNADRDRRFNRLSSIAGIGQTANSALGAAGQNYANNAGSNMMGAANAAGAAGMASANAWGGAMSGIGKMGMEGVAMNNQNNWMNQWMQNRNTSLTTPTYDFSGADGMGGGIKVKG